MDNRKPYDVVSIGEAMLRLSPPAGVRLEVANSFDVHVGGAESNVAAALARLGHRSAWVSSLPDDALGRRVANQMRMAGVDLSFVTLQTSGRLGLYYADMGTSPRPTSVIYDRQGSCFSALKAALVDWESVLNTRLLHISGITPALSVDAHKLARHAIELAHDTGVAVSIDVNYREKLWTPQQARSALLPLMEGAELLFCAERDARRVFGIEGAATDKCLALAQMSRASHVVVSSGEQGVNLISNGKFQHEPAIAAQSIDPIGAGDALAAGVIHGWLSGELDKGLRCGVVMAALAHGQKGDMLATAPDEIEALLASGATSILR